MRNVDRDWNWIVKPRVDRGVKWTYPRSRWLHFRGTVPELVAFIQSKEIARLGLRVSRSKGSFWDDVSGCVSLWWWLFREVRS